VARTVSVGVCMKHKYRTTNDVALAADKYSSQNSSVMPLLPGLDSGVSMSQKLAALGTR